jgi:hypothetical protein
MHCKSTLVFPSEVTVVVVPKEADFPHQVPWMLDRSPTARRSSRKCVWEPGG